MLPIPKLFLFPTGRACSHHNFHEERKKTFGAALAKMAEESVREDVGEGRSRHTLPVPSVAPLGRSSPCQTLGVIGAVTWAV